MDERLKRRNSSKEFDSSVPSSPDHFAAREENVIREIPAAKVNIGLVSVLIVGPMLIL